MSREALTPDAARHEERAREVPSHPVAPGGSAGEDADRIDEEELIMHLERDQLVAETFRPVARAQFGRRALVGLWALRVFVVLVSAMVIYTFAASLG
jgi:hypothetical protein